MSFPLIRVSDRRSSTPGSMSAGSSTIEKSGRIWIAPKSSRRSPPSFASAPTIWRGSTRWRRPTSIRYAVIGC